MTAQQQSLYLKIAIVTTVVTAIVLLGIAASVAGIKHHLDHSKNHTILALIALRMICKKLDKMKYK